ncbi:unnamed protein product [Adineta steineri]|uniref:NHL repeat containing protein n=2 Tax=Adineta steineri TaxID=433720 RepID=A0A818YFD1_9BILA|nr:unnamed protein product [Adineta steineri]
MILSTNISAFNYFLNNTCQFFSNASLTNASFSWKSDINGQFYFLQLPTRATVATQDTTSISPTTQPLTTVASSTSTIKTSTQLPTTNVPATSMLSTVTTVRTTMMTILPSTVAGNGVMGHSMQELDSPNDVFVTANGTLYVADYDNNRIQIFGPNNTTAIFSQNGMGSPITVCVDNASNYYVTEIESPNRISKWPGNQTVLSLFNAYGLAMDSQKNFYLSTLSNTIVFWNATSNINITLVPSTLGLSDPRHISLDESNQFLYIADTSNNRVVKLNLGTRNLTVVAGGHGQGTATNQLNSPAGVCVSKKDGTIYVADTGNNRIQKWMVNGTFGVTILGNSSGISGSGIYQLNAPYAVALNPAETFLYVADSNNNRVQRMPLY